MGWKSENVIACEKKEQKNFLVQNFQVFVVVVVLILVLAVFFFGFNQWKLAVKEFFYETKKGTPTHSRE